MRMIQRTLLHFAAYAALLLSVYPIIAMAYTLSGLGTVHIWLSELYVFITGAAALFHAIAVRRIYRRRAVIVNISFTAAGALAAAAAFMLCPCEGVFMKLISAFVIFAVYMGGSRLFFVEYDALTHTYVYAGICAVFAASSAVVWLHDHSAGFIWQIITFLAVSGVFALCRNFAGIDTALQSQGEESGHLPSGILRYNRTLLGAVCAFVLVLVLVRKPIGAFLSYISGKALKLAGKIYFWFSGLFTGKEQESTELSEIIYEPSYSGYHRNDSLVFICTVLLLAVCVYIILRNRHRISAFIAGIIPSIRRMLARIFGRSYERQERCDGFGYTDIVTELREDEAREHMKTAGRMNWRKEYRRFRRMEDGAEKYRLGYSLLLYRLKQQGMELAEASTPEEVLSSLPPEYSCRGALEAVTRCYERVRYGEVPPEEHEMRMMEKTVRELKDSE